MNVDNRILKTAWWLIPACILGAAIWALLIVEVMG